MGRKKTSPHLTDGSAWELGVARTRWLARPLGYGITIPYQGYRIAVSYIYIYVI